ncbi:hypothetical protein NDU88_002956 [Pleurodeles waltl]|uniref:Uncharacterized protein n=1 Tax=Pleurodeles waltl TaxID=8319 RepID=A0AAV7W3X6_PLEWA|nr:hypothetical protein NDU88_002956 [Pleurodeles waltl]
MCSILAPATSRDPKQEAWPLDLSHPIKICRVFAWGWEYDLQGPVASSHLSCSGMLPLSSLPRDPTGPRLSPQWRERRSQLRGLLWTSSGAPKHRRGSTQLCRAFPPQPFRCAGPAPTVTWAQLAPRCPRRGSALTLVRGAAAGTLRWLQEVSRAGPRIDPALHLFPLLWARLATGELLPLTSTTAVSAAVPVGPPLPVPPRQQGADQEYQMPPLRRIYEWPGAEVCSRLPLWSPSWTRRPKEDIEI